MKEGNKESWFPKHAYNLVFVSNCISHFQHGLSPREAQACDRRKCNDKGCSRHLSCDWSRILRGHGEIFQTLVTGFKNQISLIYMILM